MSLFFANPWGLFALLGLPTVVWLHYFVLRARQQDVACLALWVDTAELGAEGRTRRRPPFTWVLLLELLAALCAALLFAGLRLESGSQSVARVGVVIDTSASMAGRGDRGERPLDAAAGWIESLARHLPNAEVTVVASGERPRILGGQAFSPAEAAEAVRALEPTNIHHGLERALELLGASGIRPESRWIFSDDPELHLPGTVFVGAPVGNLALVAGGWQAGATPFVVVRRFAAQPDDVVLRIVEHGLSSPRERAKTINFRESDEVLLELPVAAETVRLDIILPGDALAVDNHVTLLAPPERRVGVRIAHPNRNVSRAFGQVVAALPIFGLSNDTLAPLLISDASFKVEGVQMVSIPNAADAGATTRVRSFAIDPFSSLMDGFDANGLVWFAGPRIVKREARVLLAEDNRPLIWQNDGILSFNIDLERSNFFRHAAFVVLLANLAEDLNAEVGGLPLRTMRQGERLRFGRPADCKGGLRVSDPKGEQLAFAEHELHIELGTLDQAGLYDVACDNFREQLAVNFFDPHEGDLLRRPQPSSEPVAITPDEGWRRGQDLLTLILIAVALASLLAAWRLLGKARSAT